MSQPLTKTLLHKPVVVLTALVVLLLAVRVLSAPVNGAQLGQRSMTLSTSIVDGVGSQKLSFRLTSIGVLGSVAVEYCTNSPFVTDPCTAPTGLDASAASLSAQSGQTGFTVTSGSTANKIVIGRTPATATAGPVSYTFDAIHNPSITGSYFVRLQTYASADGTGVANDYGAIVIAINANLAISAEVPPYIIFCVGATIASLNCSSANGNYVDFGELSSTHANQGTSQLLTATNARDGYNIFVSGTTLTSGNNVISPLDTADVSRSGNSQFGLNLRANSSPAGGTDPGGPGLASPVTNYGQPNFYKFTPGDTLVSVNKPDDIRRYTASYIVNIPKTQAPGVYVSTVTYTCLANF
ncbi:MAG: hypothetical protein JWM81_401 [Candidatus Saccharibacteria bacterium]|nr:hypothetical protein [Candidatus Saccharibacteria bacterium]